MGVPTLTARSTPGGRMLDDGYQSLVAFESDPDVSLWEKTVQPVGFDGGDKIDVTTMHNETVRTYATRSLIDITDGAMTVAYDPACLDQILALLNVEQAISVHLPDGSAWVFFGAMTAFEPQSNEEGSQPEANVTLVATNVDPADGTEAVPNYVTPAGTP